MPSFHLLTLLENYCTQLEEHVYFGHGTDNAWDEVIYLLLHVMQLPIDTPLDSLQKTLTDEEKAQLHTLITRRMQENIPAAYLTGEAWFCGLPFYVDERVLIPRSPIAELIEERFSPWLAQPPARILELCTGSGCIAIAAALAFPQAEVDATDIDPRALAVAHINREKHGLDNRLALIQADLFAGLCPARQYDLIIANPPYVDDTEMSTLPAEYGHEPDHALRSPEQGLYHINRILQQARTYLKPHGILVGEVGNSMEALMTCWPKLPFMWPEFEYGGHGIFILTAGQLS